MKKILSVLALSMPVLVYCGQPSAETILPGTESFYRQHPPVYHYGSNALIWLNEISIHVHVKDLITTEKVMPYLPFSEGSPSLPFVGYLQSANELSLEITVNKNGKQIKFDQTFTNLPFTQQSIKFNIPSQPDASHQKQYSIHGEIRRVMITWWSRLFETKEVVAYEIRIDDLEETNLSSEPIHEEPSTVFIKTPEVTKNTISESDTDNHKKYPLVVYGTTKKTVSFMDKEVPAELKITALIDKNKQLDSNTSICTPGEKLLGLLPDKEKPLVSVRIQSPIGEVVFFEHLTELAQRKENHLSAKDSDGKEYQLQVFAVKDTLRINETTPPVDCYHIGFGDEVTTVTDNQLFEDSNTETVVANTLNIIPSCFQGEPVKDKIAQEIKKGRYVFVMPGFANQSHGKKSRITAALSYFRTNTPINPEGAAEINSRIAGQYAGYEFLGIHDGTTELIVMIDGQVEGRRIGLTTHTVHVPSRYGYLWAYITPTEMEFNMTPGAPDPVYEKVPVYIVKITR